MTFPVVLHLGSSIIPVHPIFETLAFFVAYRFYVYLKKRRHSDPLAPDAAWWIIVGMAVGAFVGSRLVAALEDPAQFIHVSSWIYYISNQTIAGALGGGILGVEVTKWILKVKRRTGDLFVYPLILGIIVGRIGCLLTGVTDGTVGLPSNLPWAFDQGDGIPRHPTSLYEIVFLIIIWLLIKRIERLKILKEGDLFSVFVVGYSLFRFCVEFIKPRDPLWLGLSSIQLLAAGLVIYYSLYFIRRYKKSIL